MFEALKKMFENNLKTVEVVSPVNGTTIPMSDVSDQFFAKEFLGPGIAVIPSDGRIVSPINGEIVNLVDTKHAVCIEGENQIQLIVHIGIDTVELHSEFFEAHIKNGDQIKKGDHLIDVDLHAAVGAGYDITTPMVIIDLGAYKIAECVTGKKVQAGEKVIKLVEK